MMNPFPAYLHEPLKEKLKERRVDWGDSNRDFMSVFGCIY